MSKDAIFLLSDSGDIQRVEHQLYKTEDILQELVAKHPELLAGDQIDAEAPPRWLLVRREAAIPAEPHGEDRWWLDHLLLDQFGMPTLVEVKRSTDTRIRREVIGQMLDYVANAQENWVAGRMREMLAKEMGSVDAADARLVQFLGLVPDDETVPEEINAFWQTVEANLRKGDVRLLFVADELPRELRRLIEFLNEQFKNVEVLGVELRQYVGQDIRALVPRVIGQTVAARNQKERVATSRTYTTREKFLSSCGQEAKDFFDKLIDDAERQGFRVNWATKGFTIRAEGYPVFFFAFPPGVLNRDAPSIEIYLKDVANARHLADEMRAYYSTTPGATTGGRYTIRLFVTSTNLRSADTFARKTFDFLRRQTLELSD